MSQTKKLISLVLAALLLTGLLTAAAGATDSSAATEKAESVSFATGTDMRLMRTRGSVSLLDASGAALPFQEAMRLFSG